MKRSLITATLSVLIYLCAAAQTPVTLDYCLQKSRDNYPLIKKYELLANTCAIELSDINKGWLPRIGVYGQAAIQNAVPSFPKALSGVMSQMGQDVKGMGHVQYKIGVDLSQTVWDGGGSRAKRRIVEAGKAESDANIDVQMYAIREKVQNLFFAILLIDEQIRQNQATVSLLESNHRQMLAMVADGTAMQSDADMIEAQILTVAQFITEARHSSQAYREALGLYMGESIEGRELAQPEAEMPADMSSDRPELRLFNARIALNEANDKAVTSSVMPKIGFFTQAYYGYPGFNYFESIMSRDMSFNLLAGLKVSWNIDSFYSKKNSHHRLAMQTSAIMNDRELFLFNTRIQTQSQASAIDGMRQVIKDDARIVGLRANVRRAAEVQLADGVIDATALLAKINDENQAILTARYHEIQLIQNIYQLKFMLNR